MQIPFYFDYGCPWAYLGSCRAESYFADLGVELDYRAAQLSVMREAPANPLPEGVKPPGMGPRKAANAANDFRHWASLCGAEFSPDARRHRRDTSLLVQGFWVAKDAGVERAYHMPAYRARWAEALDISSEQVVRDLLAKAGLDGDDAIERAKSDEMRARARAESEAAIERGVFGVPTLFVGDEMFWGNDRFELVRHYIEKARS